MKRTTIRIPDELLKRAKTRASQEGRTLTSLVEEGLHLVLTPPLKSPSKRPKLPVSKATGGLNPGVDLTRNAHLLDLLADE